MSRTLGLDIGANSIGWALVQASEKPSIVDIGVRVFPEGVDRDTKGLEKSKNTARREARGARRCRQRRTRRKNILVKTLKEYSLWPKDERDEFELLTKEPYQLRAKNNIKTSVSHISGAAVGHLDITHIIVQLGMYELRYDKSP